jgi:hypothetical protein
VRIGVCGEKRACASEVQAIILHSKSAYLKNIFMKINEVLNNIIF